MTTNWKHCTTSCRITRRWKELKSIDWGSTHPDPTHSGMNIGWKRAHSLRREECIVDPLILLVFSINWVERSLFVVMCLSTPPMIKTTSWWKRLLPSGTVTLTVRFNYPLFMSSLRPTSGLPLDPVFRLMVLWQDEACIVNEAAKPMLASGAANVVDATSMLSGAANYVAVGTKMTSVLMHRRLLQAWISSFSNPLWVAFFSNCPVYVYG